MESQHESTVQDKCQTNPLKDGSPMTSDEALIQLTGMSKIQLYDIMSEMKVLIEQNQQQARQILIDNPGMTKALFQAQMMLGMVPPPNLNSLSKQPLESPQTGQQVQDTQTKKNQLQLHVTQNHGETRQITQRAAVQHGRTHETSQSNPQSGQMLVKPKSQPQSASGNSPLQVTQSSQPQQSISFPNQHMSQPMQQPTHNWNSAMHSPSHAVSPNMPIQPHVSRVPSGQPQHPPAQLNVGFQQSVPRPLPQQQRPHGHHLPHQLQNRSAVSMGYQTPFSSQQPLMPQPPMPPPPMPPPPMPQHPSYMNNPQPPLPNHPPPLPNQPPPQQLFKIGSGNPLHQVSHPSPDTTAQGIPHVNFSAPGHMMQPGQAPLHNMVPWSPERPDHSSIPSTPQVFRSQTPYDVHNQGVILPPQHLQHQATDQQMMMLERVLNLSQEEVNSLAPEHRLQVIELQQRYRR